MQEKNCNLWSKIQTLCNRNSSDISSLKKVSIDSFETSIKPPTCFSLNERGFFNTPSAMDISNEHFGQKRKTEGAKDENERVKKLHLEDNAMSLEF